MNIPKTHYLCGLLFLFCLWSLVALPPEVLGGAAPTEIQENSHGMSTVDTSPESTASNPDKYAFQNLAEDDQEQVITASKTEGLFLQEKIADQMTFDFRAKQEEIRLYEVILLAVMSLFTLTIVLKTMKDSDVCSARDMLNGTGLVLVIFATVMVIIIADVEIQLTAAMGVLGGIAGYLFGTLRSSTNTGRDAKNSQPKPEIT